MLKREGVSMASDRQTPGKTPFHKGEKSAQARMGVEEIEEWAKKVVRDYLPDQHRRFYAQLPYIIVAARDENAHPWATILEGEVGFIESPDPHALTIKAMTAPGDALERAIKRDNDLGILGIELASRRRNRVNGAIEEVTDGEIKLRVGQTFGNCPQYIRERNWRRADPQQAKPPIITDKLTASQQDWIAGADTFFIASGYRGEGASATFGMDASHRGGERGFVRVLDERRLSFPDYAGNNHFNTIGNLMLDPRAGFLFVDFETGSLLQLTGRARIDWDSDQVKQSPGARRLINFSIDKIIELRSALSLRWDSDADSVRSLRVTEKIRESDEVTSLVFRSRDGGPLAPFAAGQHLPLELHVAGIEEPVRRSYSLSGAPSTDHYRISVKRKANGLASRHIHDCVEPGAILESRAPAGEFVLRDTGSPVVLLSAGVGITPMQSMLHMLAGERSHRPVWFIHGARNSRHHPFLNETLRLAAECSKIEIHVRYSKPLESDVLGETHHSTGRVDVALVQRLVRRPDAQYFLCGPITFLAGMQNALEKCGIPTEQIHTETFGPVG